MFILLLSIVWGVFAAMLFLNVYFRVKVMKAYRVLVQNRIQFDAAHLFSRKKMEEEIYPKYPQHRQEIEQFANHIRYSMRMATLLSVLISLFAAILMWYRHE
jgi:hypothetical protein